MTEENEELIEILMDIIFDEDNSIRIDRIEGLLEVISDTSSIPGKELIPVASNGLKLLIGNKGSEIRKKLLLSLIKNDEFNANEIKELIKLFKRKFNPIEISNKLLRKYSCRLFYQL